MMKTKQYSRTPFYSFIAAAALFLTGCSSTFDVKATSSKSLSNFNLKLNFGPALVTALQAITGSQNTASLFTQEDLNSAQDLSQISSLKLTESTDKTLQLTGSIATGNIISRTDNSLTISLTPENLLAFYKSLNEESRLYLDLLMAPVFTEEEMTEEDYIGFLSSIYGQDLANELSQAYININLTSPTGTKTTTYSLSFTQLLTGHLQNSTYNLRW